MENVSTIRLYGIMGAYEMKIQGVVGPPEGTVYDDKASIVLSNTFVYWRGVKVGEVNESEVKDGAVHFTATITDKHVQELLNSGQIGSVRMHGKI